MEKTVVEKIRQLIFPNKLRGHAVMLSSFVTGNIYFIILTADFSAALGLAAGIITAPIGFLAGAATLYTIRKALNLEFKGLRKEAKHQNIELNQIPEIKSGDLLETSKKLYNDRKSWEAAVLSLLKFPIGLASLIFITIYLSLSISLISAPLTYKSINLQVHNEMLNTPVELTAAAIAGIIIYITGANSVEKASKLYLKINSLIK